MEEYEMGGNTLERPKLFRDFDAPERLLPEVIPVIPLLLGMLPAQPHPSQINGCLSTQAPAWSHAAIAERFQEMGGW